MNGSALRIRRLGYALGAQVTGVDLTKAVDDETLDAIRNAWLEHLVLCFPDQDFGPEEMIAFATRYGPLDDMRRTPKNRHPEYDVITMLSNKPVSVKGTTTGGHPYGHQWHSDRQFTDRPATISFLNAKQIPGTGGDTLFANTALAYDALSASMRRLLDGLEGVHDTSVSDNFASRSPEVQAAQRKLNPPMAHPVVRVHPETGRRSLFVGSYVRKFVGMTEEESKPLLAFLLDHATRYEFTYRHRWTVNDLILWDNRGTMHKALLDYDGSQLRRMIRCSLVAPKSGRIDDDAQAREPVAVRS